ncbi:hypothetical protein GSQ54_08865 [Clostridioides difficile]|nr:hypothetical protein [Clostridioides difficile]
MITKDKIKELIELCHQLEKLVVQMIKSAEQILFALISFIGLLLVINRYD